MAGVFGFKTDIEFTREEFFLFLDSLFRGLAKVLIAKGETKPTCTIQRIRSKELMDIVNLIFQPDEAYLPREEFLGHGSRLKS